MTTPKLKPFDATLYAVLMNTGLRWLPVAAAVGAASFSLWTLALFVFFIPLACATAELTERFKAEGGIYVWVRDTYGPLAGFLCGWFYWFSLMPYLAGILYFLSGLFMSAVGADPHDKTLYLLISIALGVFVTAFQFVGLAFNKWLTNFGAAGSWLIFFLLAGLALYFLAQHQSATDFAASSYLPKLDFNTAILWGTIVFAYSGLEAIGFLRNEIEGGIKTVRRVLVIVGIAVGILYILGTGAMLVLLPSSQMSRLGGFADVLGAVFGHAAMPRLAPIALGALAISMLGGFAAWFGAGARLPLAAGIDHFLPEAFGRRNARTGAPVASILLQGGLMLVFVVLSQAGATAAVAYDFLVSMSVLTNTLCYVFMFAAYFTWSRAGAVPGLWQPPGGMRTSVILAVVGQISTLVAIACTLVPGADDAHPWGTFFKITGSALVMLVSGLVLYWLGTRRAAAHQGAVS